MIIFEGDDTIIACYIKGSKVRVDIHEKYDVTELQLNNQEAAKLSKILHKLSEEVGIINSELPE